MSCSLRCLTVSRRHAGYASVFSVRDTASRRSRLCPSSSRPNFPLCHLLVQASVFTSRHQQRASHVLSREFPESPCLFLPPHFHTQKSNEVRARRPADAPSTTAPNGVYEAVVTATRRRIGREASEKARDSSLRSCSKTRVQLCFTGCTQSGFDRDPPRRLIAAESGCPLAPSFAVLSRTKTGFCL